MSTITSQKIQQHDERMAEIKDAIADGALSTMTCACCGAIHPIDTPNIMVDRSMSRLSNGAVDYSGLCARCYATPAWKNRLKGPEHPVPTKCACQA